MSTRDEQKGGSWWKQFVSVNGSNKKKKERRTKNRKGHVFYVFSFSFFREKDTVLPFITRLGDGRILHRSYFPLKEKKMAETTIKNSLFCIFLSVLLHFLSLFSRKGRVEPQERKLLKIGNYKLIRRKRERTGGNIAFREQMVYSLLYQGL